MFVSSIVVVHTKIDSLHTQPLHSMEIAQKTGKNNQINTSGRKDKSTCMYKKKPSVQNVYVFNWKLMNFIWNKKTIQSNLLKSNQSMHFINSTHWNLWQMFFLAFFMQKSNTHTSAVSYIYRNGWEQEDRGTNKFEFAQIL